MSFYGHFWCFSLISESSRTHVRHTPIWVNLKTKLNYKAGKKMPGLRHMPRATKQFRKNRVVGKLIRFLTNMIIRVHNWLRQGYIYYLTNKTYWLWYLHQKANINMITNIISIDFDFKWMFFIIISMNFSYSWIRMLIMNNACSVLNVLFSRRIKCFQASKTICSNAWFYA